MPEIHGNTEGIRKTMLDELCLLYDAQLPPDEILPHELLVQLCGYSASINREIALYITRDGEVADILIGKTSSIDLPDLRLRRSEKRLSMIRCIHTHPGATGQLSDVDLSALVSMRFDAMIAIGVSKDGKPTSAGVATLDPDQASGIDERELIPAYKLNHTPLLEQIDQLDRRFMLTDQATQKDQERAVLVGIETEESLSELSELAKTAGALPVLTVLQKRAKPDSTYCIGRGKAEELALDCQSARADVVIFDEELSGVMQKNLEEILRVKVVDRTTLILDIFALRAKTREGKLQVEMAQLKYRSQRLLGQGLVLSRLAGGIGTRGPGESKLEVNRRRIRERLNDLQHELEKMERQRGLRRREREKNRIPIIALVGYTNAGKSTLFKQMTGTEVYIQDQLFATLDSVSRPITLPHGHPALLVDTVGFIRKLPHELVKAFRSTLEEAALADLIVIVSDGANPEAVKQHATVEEVLGSLGAIDSARIDALNKCDKQGYQQDQFPGAFAISALSGEGVAALMEKAEELLLIQSSEATLLVPFNKYGILSKLHEMGSVYAEEHRDDGVLVRVRARKEIVNLACQEGATLMGDEIK